MTAVARLMIRGLPVPRASRTGIAWMAAVVSVITVVALVAVAGFPTGERSPVGLVPPGARLAAEVEVDDVRVLVTVQAGELVGIIVYEGPKGWLGVDLEPVPGSTAAAWAATRGDGPVPALSTVYGRAEGTSVRVEWVDGESATTRTARDGAYVVARHGRVGVDRVVVLDADGGTVLEVTEL